MPSHFRSRRYRPATVLAAATMMAVIMCHISGSESARRLQQAGDGTWWMQQEAAALLEWKNSLRNIPAGSAVKSWNSNKPMCGGGWRGVSCQGNRLVALYLHNSGIAGSVPTQLSTCKKLFLLDMSKNVLTGELPAEWSRLNPGTIDLSNNLLRGSLPPEWSTMDNLLKLNLEGNYISGELPSEWAAMTGLDQLDLDGNRLGGELPAEWGALKGLSNMGLDGNSFSGSMPESWEALKDLVQDMSFVKPPPPASSPTTPDRTAPPPPPFWVPNPPGTSIKDVDGLGNAPPPPPPSSGMPIWQIATIVALGLLALVAIAALILMLVCCLCKKKKNVADNPHPKTEQEVAAVALKASAAVPPKHAPEIEAMPVSPPRELRHSPSTPASLGNTSSQEPPPSFSQKAVTTLTTYAEDLAADGPQNSAEATELTTIAPTGVSKAPAVGNVPESSASTSTQL